MANAESNGNIRERLQALKVGRKLDFDVPQGETLREFAARVCVVAHRALGKGCYRSEAAGGKLRITRLPKAQQGTVVLARATAPLAANEPDDRLVTRKQAAEFLEPWFPQGISANQLRNFCNLGKGPPGIRNGKHVLHRIGDLRAWANGRLQPVDQRDAA